MASSDVPGPGGSRQRVPPPPPPGFGDDEYYRLYGRPEDYHRYRAKLERQMQRRPPASPPEPGEQIEEGEEEDFGRDRFVGGQEDERRRHGHGRRPNHLGLISAHRRREAAEAAGHAHLPLPQPPIRPGRSYGDDYDIHHRGPPPHREDYHDNAVARRPRHDSYLQRRPPSGHQQRERDPGSPVSGAEAISPAQSSLEEAQLTPVGHHGSRRKFENFRVTIANESEGTPSLSGMDDDDDEDEEDYEDDEEEEVDEDDDYEEVEEHREQPIEKSRRSKPPPPSHQNQRLSKAVGRQSRSAKERLGKRLPIRAPTPSPPPSQPASSPQHEESPRRQRHRRSSSSSRLRSERSRKRDEDGEEVGPPPPPPPPERRRRHHSHSDSHSPSQSRSGSRSRTPSQSRSRSQSRSTSRRGNGNNNGHRPNRGSQSPSDRRRQFTPPASAPTPSQQQQQSQGKKKRKKRKKRAGTRGKRLAELKTRREEERHPHIMQERLEDRQHENEAMLRRLARKRRGRQTSESNKMQSLARLAGIEIPEESMPKGGGNMSGRRNASKRSRRDDRGHSRSQSSGSDSNSTSGRSRYSGSASRSPVRQRRQQRQQRGNNDQARDRGRGGRRRSGSRQEGRGFGSGSGVRARRSISQTRRRTSDDRNSKVPPLGKSNFRSDNIVAQRGGRRTASPLRNNNRRRRQNDHDPNRRSRSRSIQAATTTGRKGGSPKRWQHDKFTVASPIDGRGQRDDEGEDGDGNFGTHWSRIRSERSKERMREGRSRSRSRSSSTRRARDKRRARKKDGRRRSSSGSSSSWSRSSSRSSRGSRKRGRKRKKSGGRRRHRSSSYSGSSSGSYSRSRSRSSYSSGSHSSSGSSARSSSIRRQRRRRVKQRKNTETAAVVGGGAVASNNQQGHPAGAGSSVAGSVPPSRPVSAMPPVGPNGDGGAVPEGPNMQVTGKLLEDTNMVNGVTVKYSEPPEARKPKIKWRLYVFKGNEELPILYIHRQSAYLLGRDRKVADIPLDHPSCSKQHAVLQYRLVDFTRPDGSRGKRVKPYVVDMNSANGTFVNNQKIESQKYVEVLEKDVIKFGFSSREYVLLHDQSKVGEEEDPGLE